MTSKFLAAAAATAIVAASGLALAQEDRNNPAPSYSGTAPVQNQNVQHIQDGNNPSPRYSAPASTSAASNKQVTHIQDGNNPAPRYNAPTTAATPKAKATGTHATKKRGNNPA
jgi:hypothetical protein